MLSRLRPRAGWQRAVVLCCAVATVIGYGVAIWLAGLQDFARAVGEIGIPALGLVLIGLLANVGLRYARWRWYLDALGHRLPLRASLECYFSGFLFTVTPGKAGELLRSVYLKAHGVPYATSVCTFVAERICDTMAMVALAFGAGVVHHHGYQRSVVFLGLLSGLLIVLLCSAGLREPMRRWSERLPSGTIRALAQRGLEALDAVSLLLSGRVLAGSVALGIVAWAAQAFALCAILAATGATAPMAAVLGAYAISALVGSLSLIPAGLGSTDLTLGVLLLALGVAPADAIAATLLFRSATLGFAVMLGILALFSLHGRRRGQPAR